jgi:hypothetical protein
MKNNPKFLLLFLFLLIYGVAFPQEKSIIDQLEEIAIVDQKVMMPMRDGVRLATDIYRPKGDDPVPIVFSRTPYNFNTYGNGEMNTRGMQSALEWVKKGYAYVVQNERGRFFSEGEWDILGTPLTDGYDAMEWMSKQPWSNEKIGTLGCSSTAEWQMAVASMNHPAHRKDLGQAWEESGNFMSRAIGIGAVQDKCFSPPGFTELSMTRWHQSFLLE